MGNIEAHVGAAAAAAAADIGAAAYATDSNIAFARPPDLHTAAHEAAHVVQQRGGVQLKSGVGQAGDQYEQHADAVADLVVRGESAEMLLDQFAGDRASADGAATSTPRVQMSPDPAVHDHAGKLRQLADPRDPSNPNNALNAREMYEKWRSHWTSREAQANERLREVRKELRSQDPLGYAESKEKAESGLPEALGPEYEAAEREAALCSTQLSSMEEVLKWLEDQETLGRRVTLDQVNRHAMEWAKARDTWGSIIEGIFFLGLPVTSAVGRTRPVNAGPKAERGGGQAAAGDELSASGPEVAPEGATNGPIAAEAPRSLGAAATGPRINWSWKSRKTFGHTFTTHGHGARRTRGLEGRAAGTGEAQGQWLDNEAAAQFLAAERPYLQGPASVAIPQGVPAQIIFPDGRIVPATRATLVPSPSGGYSTAYPIP